MKTNTALCLTATTLILLATSSCTQSSTSGLAVETSSGENISSEAALSLATSSGDASSSASGLSSSADGGPSSEAPIADTCAGWQEINPIYATLPAGVAEQSPANCGQPGFLCIATVVRDFSYTHSDFEKRPATNPYSAVVPGGVDCGSPTQMGLNTTYYTTALATNYQAYH